jgi:pimeloyl-ACP methyl ester carboxylesterase
VSSRHFLFVHGGPGFNSYSEKKLLEPLFQRENAAIDFWNEPSLFRPKGEAFSEKNAFSNWYHSLGRKLEGYRKLEQKVAIIGHSYAANGLVRVLDEYSDVVSGVTIISSALNIYDTYKRIALLGRDLHQKENQEKAREIDLALSASKTFFDPPLVQAIILAAELPTLFDYYWTNKTQMVRAREAATEAEAQFDFQSFMSVNSDLAAHLSQPKILAFDGLVRVVFGENDPIVKMEREKAILISTFKNLELHRFKESSHYPHLEDSERFLEVVLK